MARDRWVRGQSTVGVILLISIAVVGASVTVALGATALSATEQQAQLDRAAQSMTQFDSRVAQVALGDSDVQTQSFGTTAGSYAVEESSGRIVVRYVNYDPDDGTTTESVDIFDQTVGSVVYANERTTVAYQAGGVWRKGPDGDARMVSPPEFHFRSATLTFPIIEVAGDTAAGGQAKATVEELDRGVDVWPHPSDTYPDTDGDSEREPFDNPISNGHMEVVVHTEYPEAWADYFRARTAGDVTVSGDKTTVELLTKATGLNAMPDEGERLEMTGRDPGHTIDEWRLNITYDGNDNRFSSLDWGLLANNDGQRIAIHLTTNTGGFCNGRNPTGKDDAIDITVGFRDDSGTWQNWTKSGAFDVGCDSDDHPYAVIDLTGTTMLSYSEGPSDITLDGHGAGWEPQDADRGSTSLEIDKVVNHYVAEVDPQSFTAYEGNHRGGGADPVTASESSYYIQYQGSGNVITYLHVTENEVRVNLR